MASYIKFSLIIPFFFAISTLWGQDNFSFSFRQSVDKIKGLASYIDKDQNIFFIVPGKKELEIRSFDAKGNRLDLGKIESQEEYNFIGNSMVGDTIVFYYLKYIKEKKQEIYSLSFLSNDLSQISTGKLLFTITDQKLIQVYNQDNRMYFAYIPRGSFNMNLLSFYGNQRQEYPFHLNMISHIKYFTDKYWLYLNEGIRSNFILSSIERKYLHKGDKIYLISDLDDQTTLITMDMNTLSAVIDRYPLLTEEKKANFSSYLFDDILFRLTSEPKNAKIELYDIADRTLLKQYEFSKGEASSLINTPILSEPYSKEISQNELFYRMKLNDAGITVGFDQNNNYALRVGASKKYKTSEFLQEMLFLSSVFLNVLGTQSFEGMTVPSYNGGPLLEDSYFYHYLMVDAYSPASFFTKVDPNSYEHVPGDVELDQKLPDKDTLKKMMKGKSFFNFLDFGDHFKYCYYDSKIDHIVVYRF